MPSIEAKDATHVRLKAAVYPESEFLTAGSVHPVKEYEGSQWRLADPAHPEDASLDWWVGKDVAEPVPDPETSSAKTTLPNPKQAFGDKKPPLDEFPLSAHIHASLSHLDGDMKYGFRNWRDYPVEARTYIKGIMRHLRLFEVGEDYARDTGAHNLGAVIAGAAILIDAQLHGTMIDNRRHSKQEADLLHSAEADVERLKKLQEARDALKLAAAALAPEAEPELDYSGAPLPNGVHRDNPHAAEFPDNPTEGGLLDGDSLRHLRPKAHSTEDAFDPEVMADV